MVSKHLEARFPLDLFEMGAIGVIRGIAGM